MASVTILPVPSAGGISYCAVSNGKRSQGATAGAALDALTAQMADSEGSTLVVVQHLRPDQFFNAEQRNRLSELMARWRASRDQKEPFSPAEQAELDSLIDAELRAAAARPGDMADELKR
ncbi:MAG: hypothetical protein HY289_03990 [Planctomycetes bacterium]|nr:hypothetical protein [Planctomycetota bacterium]